MKKTALITGASSGIGKELSFLFAADNYDLILVARNKKNLSELAEELEKKFHVTTTIIPHDLSKQGSAQTLFEAVKQKHLAVDVLVNNAGFATSGKFWEVSSQEELEELQVNISSLTILTKLFLPKMIERKSGKVLNLASIAGYLPGPFMAVYYATKAYVLSFSLAVHEELKGTGVTVSALCPRQTATAFADRAGLGNKKLFKSKLLTAKEVAVAGYEGLMKNKPVIFADFQTHFLVFLLRFISKTSAAKIARGFVNE